MSSFTINKKILEINGLPTTLIDEGDGQAVVLLHGSGPGVTAEANWSNTIPALLGAGYRVIAPDQLGFGGTVTTPDFEYSLTAWVDHVIVLLEKLKVNSVTLIGNSFGGGIALQLAVQRPDLVSQLILMGSVGVDFELTEGLDTVWGYLPSVENMTKVMDFFAYDRSLITQDLITLRYKASLLGGSAERFSRMFPSPRQRWIDKMVVAPELVAKLDIPTLVIHGRDDRVIPMENSLKLHQLITPSQLHVFGECGHWTQIEKKTEFNTLVLNFLENQATNST